MLNVETHKTDSATTVTVTGEVDLESSPELWADLQRRIVADADVRVDLNGVDYMDSTGVAVLVRALKQAQQVKSVLTLVRPSPRVEAVLDLARLSSLFNIEKAGN